MIKDRIWTLVSRKLSGEATASELVEIEDLIRDQAYSDLYIKAISEFWSAPTENDEEFLEATYHLHVCRLKEKGFTLEAEKEKDEITPLYFDYDEQVPKKRISSGVYFVSAVIAVAALFFIINNNKNPVAVASDTKVAQSEVATKSGSRTKIQLPDGSQVWLNGNSKLVYDNVHFGEKVREVTLSGEAYFDVVKNKNKPFIIHTNNMNIKVLGTAFNVKAYPDEQNTETSLVRGSIEVTLKGHQEKITMKANDKLIIRNEDFAEEKTNNDNGGVKKSALVKQNSYMSLGHLTFSSKDNMIMETAWVQNKLIFDNEAFEEVALKMERWYGVAIKFNDPSLSVAHFTGSFEKETVTEALAALQLTSPFTYSINNDIITIAK